MQTTTKNNVRSCGPLCPIGQFPENNESVVQSDRIRKKPAERYREKSYPKLLSRLIKISARRDDAYTVQIALVSVEA
jgi:hypothetical protein